MDTQDAIDRLTVLRVYDAITCDGEREAIDLAIAALQATHTQGDNVTTNDEPLFGIYVRDVPVLYWSQADHDLTGKGYTVLLTDSGAATSFATYDEAVADFKTLLDNLGVRTDVADDNEAELPYAFVYTNAPEAYDYGYTTQGSEKLNIDWRGRTLRCVMIPTSHVDYQIGRYQSGLYVAFRGVSVPAAQAAAEAFWHGRAIPHLPQPDSPLHAWLRTW
jgi:hypothetical protein